MPFRPLLAVGFGCMLVTNALLLQGQTVERKPDRPPDSGGTVDRVSDTLEKPYQDGMKGLEGGVQKAVDQELRPRLGENEVTQGLDKLGKAAADIDQQKSKYSSPVEKAIDVARIVRTAKYQADLYQLQEDALFGQKGGEQMAYNDLADYFEFCALQMSSKGAQGQYKPHPNLPIGTTIVMTAGDGGTDRWRFNGEGWDYTLHAAKKEDVESKLAALKAKVTDKASRDRQELNASLAPEEKELQKSGEAAASFGRETNAADEAAGQAFLAAFVQSMRQMANKPPPRPPAQAGGNDNPLNDKKLDDLSKQVIGSKFGETGTRRK